MGVQPDLSDPLCGLCVLCDFVVAVVGTVIKQTMYYYQPQSHKEHKDNYYH